MRSARAMMTDRGWGIGVVGCGNIGGRHLQALTRLEGPARIIAVDPSASSREQAAAMLRNEASRPVEPALAADIDALPGELDVVIVATAAPGRRRLLEQVLAGRRVGAVILEKVLFQHEADYAAVAELLAARGVPAWVNTPRRLYPGYRALAEQLEGSGPIGLSVELGERAGLGTNAIHFVDLLAYLAGGARGLSLRGDRMRPIGRSRHPGAVEFAGVLHGTLADGSTLAIRRDPASPAPVSLMVAARDLRAVVIETTSEALVATAGSSPGPWRWQPMPFAAPYQSALTHRVVAEILSTGRCGLPTYAESAPLHLACLAAYREALSPSLPEDEPCPVT
jgi:hypothetical protein